MGVYRLCRAENYGWSDQTTPFEACCPRISERSFAYRTLTCGCTISTSLAICSEHTLGTIVKCFAHAALLKTHDINAAHFCIAREETVNCGT